MVGALQIWLQVDTVTDILFFRKWKNIIKHIFGKWTKPNGRRGQIKRYNREKVGMEMGGGFWF